MSLSIFQLTWLTPSYNILLQPVLVYTYVCPTALCCFLHIFLCLIVLNLYLAPAVVVSLRKVKKLKLNYSIIHRFQYLKFTKVSVKHFHGYNPCHNIVELVLY
jgi:hypothetical protein